MTQRLVISYTGSISGLLGELRQIIDRYPPAASLADLEDGLDWELTVSIAAHPAGKRLTDPEPQPCAWCGKPAEQHAWVDGSVVCH